jgi:IclR family transcriptional regulator, acetate operon repressor
VASDRPRDRVQSVVRAFRLLELISEADGILGLAELSRLSGMAPPTIHRLMATIVDLGYARQVSSRQYVLGPKLAALGVSANSVLGLWAGSVLRQLVDEIGETANLAVLEGHEVVYVAQAPGRHSMRMFTETGRRAAAHSTAVGKAILAEMPDEAVDALFGSESMVSQTQNTITAMSTLKRELRAVRRRGYATDEEEQEVGVRCVAVAIPDSTIQGAVSISGPVGRMTEEILDAAIPKLKQAAARLTADFGKRPAS